jgi:hypothetical protein
MGRVILGGKEVIMSMHKEEVLELVRQLPGESSENFHACLLSLSIGKP